MSTHESPAILHSAAEAGTAVITASEPPPPKPPATARGGWSLAPPFGTVDWTAPPSYRAFLAEHNTFACKR